MSRTQSRLLVIALLMAIALAALDTSVVGTAMPTIIGKLGGVSLYSWVFSVYLLTSTTTVPLCGKLADLYGRKPVFLFGVALFLAGSMLCGLSQSMAQLILFRAVQGLGAGAVLPVTMTIIGDLFSIEQRARLQGFFSGVWGVASIVGPALGGLITDHVGWPWVFYINVPFGLVAAGLVTALLHERIEHRRRQIDYLGSAVLTAGVTALLWGLLQGGNAWAWNSLESIATFASSGLLLVLFLGIESRAPEPVVPLSLFRNRIIAVASVAGALFGAVMYGITSFVPLFVQGVRGGTATEAGLVLAPMSLAWPVGSVAGGRLIVRFGYRLPTLLGGACLLLGGVLLAAVGQQTSWALIIVSLVLVGMGLGFMSSAFVIAIQNAVLWSQRGIATASTQFFRTIGGSIGVAILGAALAAEWSRQALDQGLGGLERSVLLDPARRALVPADLLATMQSALAVALHNVFILVALFSALVFLAALFFPKGSAAELAAGGPDQTAAETLEPVAAEGGAPPR